jgi:hypothetical protein
MTTAKRTCALHLDSQTLSDWRARELPPDDLARIARHIPTCAACQHTLGAYEQIRQVIRTQAVPTTGVPLWHATQQTIHHHNRGPMRTQQKLFIAGGLGMLAVLVLAFAIIFATALPNRGTTTPPTTSITTSTTKATATTHPPTATPVPQPLHVTPAQGWVAPASLSFGQAVAFSASDPLTGYICGSPLSGGNKSLPMEFSVTHDGGRTWSTPAQITPNGEDCKLNIDPANPNDVLIFVGGCKVPCDFGPDTPWRSFDGGATWQQLAIPTGDEASHVGVGGIAWQGTTLFVTVGVSGNYAVGAPGGIPYPPHLIAVSVSGQPLVWTNDSALATTAHKQGEVGGIFPIAGGVALYLGELTFCNGTSGAICPIYTTTDGGATWQTFTPRGSVPAQIYGANSTGSILVGASIGGAFAKSSDGGHTWSALPTDVTDTTGLLAVAITSDSTIYVGPVEAASRVFAIAWLVPGTTYWRLTDAESGSYLFQTVSTLPDGTPNALWVATNAFTQGIYHPGIAYRAP